MNNPPETPKDDGFDEDELIRSEFDSIVSGLSLDESSSSTYLDELDRMEIHQGFTAPNPPIQSPRSFFFSAKRAIARWLNRDYREDDGVAL